MEACCVRALQDFQASAAWDPAAAQQADDLLNRVLTGLQPDKQRWRERTAVVESIERVLRRMPDFTPDHLLRHNGHHSSRSDGQCLAQLHVFGSFRSTLWHRASDLDLTLMGKWRTRHGQLLDMHAMLPRDISDMLHRVLRALLDAGVAAHSQWGQPHTQQPQVIMARVPLIAFVDAHAGISVDISVSNHGGTFKSAFTRELVAFDPRFAALYRLVKLWAEVHGLNDPKCGTLNSWSLTQTVLFHLQACRPAILPPLWQLLHDEPPHEGCRPLETDLSPAQQQQQQRPAPAAAAAGSSGSGSGSSSARTPPRQQQSNPALRSSAPYELLDVAAQQRARLQPLYVAASGGSNDSLLLLLAGYVVRLRTVLRQWLELGQHRDERMSTWFGSWSAGGAPWRHEYLVAVEDPFEACDNTARTLGTKSRHDGGGQQLLQQLDRVAAALGRLQSSEDVAALMQALFEHGHEQMQAPDYDPISILQQLRAQQAQARYEQRMPEWGQRAAHQHHHHHHQQQQQQRDQRYQQLLQEQRERQQQRRQQAAQLLMQEQALPPPRQQAQQPAVGWKQNGSQVYDGMLPN